MRRFAAIGVLFALLAAGSAPAAAPPPVKPFADTSRVVVIGGSLLEIIYALGAESHVVARDATGNYPPAAVRLPSVGYMRALSPEGVLSVNPSAILAIAGSGPATALDVLARAGVPFDEVPESYSATGIVDKVLAVGTALGAEEKAKMLADRLRTELAAVERLAAQAPVKKRVLFVLSLAGGKVMASGSGTAADGIIRLAGAVNAVAGFSGYKPLDAEAVIAARPDAILVMANGGDDSTGDAALLDNPGIALTPAGRAHALIRMDGEYLLGFGPRTPNAIRELIGRLYPDLAGVD